jgi:hypothetical protein
VNKKPFNDESYYRLRDFKAKIPHVCLRTVKSWLSRVPRVKPSPRCVLYSGLVLNALLAEEQTTSLHVLPRRRTAV